LKIKVKKLSDNAVLPVKAHDSDAGADLTAVSKDYDQSGNLTYGTGISIEIPEGYAGFVFPRSSISKKSLCLANSVGVIDSGYRGEVICKFKPVAYFTHRMLGDVPEYEIGDKVAQLIILEIPKIEFIESEILEETKRGLGGFGSTGS
jgi:dUTP pyrophosphatase